MPDETRRIGLWVDSHADASVILHAINRLFAPGLLCVGGSCKNHNLGRIHLKVIVARRECWDIRAIDTSGNTVAVAAREYAPHGVMPAKFYQRLYKPWRRIK